MSISVDDAIELSKSIIAEFHRSFVKRCIENFDHVMAIKAIITATCKHFPKEHAEVEGHLRDYALNLFQKEWLRGAREDNDEYDEKRELREASGVFLRIYKTGKDAL